MERRRLQRQAYGRQVARGIINSLVEVAMFLGLSVASLVFVRQGLVGEPAGNFRYLFIPVIATLCVVGASVQQSLSVPENLPAVWAKAFGWLLVVWALWLYDPDIAPGCRPGTVPDPWSTPQEQAIFTIFLVLEFITFLVWLVMVKVYPLAVNSLSSALWALRWFWRLRPSVTRPGWTSYLPNGPCCTPRRHRFVYDGDVDAHGRPEGRGTWRDDSYHGEVLEGEWRQGRPVAPFVSRVFGSGAISLGLRVGYGTTRAEGVSGLSSVPRRAPGGQLRFGALGVECSVAGGFLAHLPQVVPLAFDGDSRATNHTECSSAFDAVAQLHGVGRTLVRAISNNGGGGGGGAVGHYASVASVCTQASFGAAPAGADLAALVFVHGYNCPLDWAAMRLGQLISLGKLNPHILPFVFSWSCGRVYSYFSVLRQLDDLACDLPAFLAELKSSAGISKVHIIAHSMGCDLVARAVPMLEALVNGPPQTLERRASSGDTGGAEANRQERLEIVTVTFFNSSCPEKDFLAEEGHLQGLLRICRRVTLYTDQNDWALRGAEILGGAGRCIGRRVSPIWSGSAESKRVDVVDCTSMDANVNGIRHSYFDLNGHVLGDFQELLKDGQPASRRSRLVRAGAEREGNVFAFLAPPVFVNW